MGGGRLIYGICLWSEINGIWNPTVICFFMCSCLWCCAKWFPSIFVHRIPVSHSYVIFVYHIRRSHSWHSCFCASIFFVAPHLFWALRYFSIHDTCFLSAAMFPDAYKKLACHISFMGSKHYAWSTRAYNRLHLKNEVASKTVDRTYRIVARHYGEWLDPRWIARAPITMWCKRY